MFPDGKTTIEFFFNTFYSAYGSVVYQIKDKGDFRLYIFMAHIGQNVYAKLARHRDGVYILANTGPENIVQKLTNINSHPTQHYIVLVVFYMTYVYTA